MNNNNISKYIINNNNISKDILKDKVIVVYTMEFQNRILP